MVVIPCIFLDSSARAEESKIFVGKIEKSGPAFRYWWCFTVVAGNGESKDFRVPKGGSTIMQIDGKQRYGEAPRKGRKIEVKYFVTERGDNETVSMRYVPLDYVQPTIVPEKPTNTVTQVIDQPKNILIGKVKDITGIAPGFVNNWTYAKISVFSDNGNEFVFFINKNTILTNENGVTNPPLPKNNQRVEVKYSIGQNGNYEAVCIRYVPSDYVSQPAVLTTSTKVFSETTQAAREVTCQTGDTFAGRVESVKKMLPRPPYWRLALLTVVAESGKKSDIDIASDTVVTDASGKELGKGRTVWQLKNGEHVEVRYLPAANSGHDKAVSIHCLD